ncbi:3-carboxy-cis,cis-muconate cycloisomerase [Mycobacteroides abscessus subsp. abscessus]|nr:3-carboxy-cis,cis-muconate cycloisomerase [Mycobacteroides abscessus subsp. abscessus]
MQFLALVAASLGKIALDVMLMMTNELGEAFEPFVKGRGASSTMPCGNMPAWRWTPCCRTLNARPGRGISNGRQSPKPSC